MNVAIPVGALLAFLLVLGSEGKPHPVERLSDDVKLPGPQRCCMPDQYSVQLTDMASVNSDAVSVMYIQFDFARKMQTSLVALINFTTSGKPTVTETYKSIMDFQQKVMYTIPVNDTSKCYKQMYDFPYQQCLPDDAQYLGSTYLGPMNGGLPYDGWRFTMTSSSMSVVINIAMSKQGCVPLVEGVHFPDTPQKDMTFLFTTYVPKLENPDQFNLPKSCL